MSFHHVSRPSTFARAASTSHRRQRGRGALLAVVSIGVLVSGCAGGNGETNSVGETGLVAHSGTPPAGPGGASPMHCNGTIGGTTVDEVEVPPGASCTLQGTRVDGNVSVRVGGTLVASAVAVDGDVEGEDARHVEVSDNSSIGGNLALEQGGSAAVTDSQIHGDLQWQQQTGSLVVARSRIGGNLRADQNNGGLTISGNRIGGDLECKQNIPAPTRGDNRVVGHRAGQCAVANKGEEAIHRRGTRSRPRVIHQRPPCAGDSVSDDPSDDQCDAGGED